MAPRFHSASTSLIENTVNYTLGAKPVLCDGIVAIIYSYNVLENSKDYTSSLF
jgi:hypothetical protein